MNRNESTATGAATALLAVLVLSFSSGASAGYIALTPAETNVLAGQNFQLELTIGGLGEQEIVSGFDLTALFDPAILAVNGFTFGGALGGADATLSDAAPGAGSFSIFSLSFLGDDELFGLQGGTVSLGFFRVTALAAGTSTFGLLPFAPVQISGAGCLESPLECSLPITDVRGAKVAVSPKAPVPVPEPQTLALLAVGLAGLILSRRRRERSSSKATRSSSRSPT